MSALSDRYSADDIAVMARLLEGARRRRADRERAEQAADRLEPDRLEPDRSEPESLGTVRP